MIGRRAFTHATSSFPLTLHLPSSNFAFSSTFSFLNFSTSEFSLFTPHTSIWFSSSSPPPQHVGPRRKDTRRRRHDRSAPHHGRIRRPNQPPARRIQSPRNSRQSKRAEKFVFLLTILPPCISTILPSCPLYSYVSSPPPYSHISSHLTSPPLPSTNPKTVTVRLQPIGSAPALTQRVFKLSTNQRFDTIVRFLRKRLGVKEHESVFCYVGSVFAPGLDEGVGGLWSVSGLLVFGGRERYGLEG